MTGKSGSITIRDIARRADVSVATVSRYINKNAPISEQTAWRIQQVMQELNYQPHQAARQLAMHQTRTIGFVLHSMPTDFFSPLINGIEAVVIENEYNLLVTTSQSFARKDSPPLIGIHNADGLLVFADCLTDQRIVQLFNDHLPMVLIHRAPPGNLPIPSVTVENRIATRKIIDHLIEKHHRKRILCIRGPAGQEDSHLREQGYIESLEAHGIAVDDSLFADGNFNGGDAYQNMKNVVLPKNIRFDAIFTGNDDAAVGVLTALAESGLRVPEDISVVGFDDLRLSAFINPPLTTLRAPTEEIGKIAARLLLDKIQGLPVQEFTLTYPEIVLRRSCGCK